MELIEDFVRAADARAGVELHSVIVLRQGEVVAEAWWAPYAREKPHLLYSLSKSFTSTALGFAVAEGSVDLDATVLSYFPEFDATVTDERSRATRVRHVAAMASGHLDETIERAWRAGDGDLLLGLLRLPPERDPGTVFAYNQPCTYALSAIVQRVSGVPLTEYLRPRLFEPLGIGTYGWQRDRIGRDIGFSGLHATTEAVARLGQLYLREGEWEGRRLLPAEWVAEATREHIGTDRENSDWSQGYGFQFWRSRHGYRGDGAYGQFMLVLPELDAVVAITSQSDDMQGLLDAAWEHLLPALGAERHSPVPENGRTPGLTLSPPGAGAGQAAPPAGVFRPAAGNELATLHTVTLDGDHLTLADHGEPVSARLGDGWTETGPVATARSGAAIDVVFTETPHRLHLTLHPADRTFTARWATTPLAPGPLALLRMP
jgi:CubicO group peptidase (beta-lactamase class C family)